MATTASPVVQIRDYLNWHTNLYAILDETASAPANLTQHNAFIKDLEEKVSDVATRIGKLESAREKEFKEHESYRDSNFKKLAYKVGGRKDKFELRKEKEEQEYYESLQHLQEAQAEQGNVQRLLDEARQQLPGFEQQMQRNAQADYDLEQLYSSIFDQPTPSFPAAEDAKLRVQQLTQELQTASQTHQKELQTLKLLRGARNQLAMVMNHVQIALSASRADMMGFGGAFADFKERAALEAATRGMHRVHQIMDGARQRNPRVRPLPKVNVAAGNIMSDVFFDNVFTDMAFHEKIKATEQEVARVIVGLEGQLTEVTQIVGSYEGRLKGIEGVMNGAKAELRMTRKGVFEAVARGNDEEGSTDLGSNNPFREQPVAGGEDAPPPYQG